MIFAQQDRKKQKRLIEATGASKIFISYLS